MKQYQGQPVTVIRDARQGDAGFDATKEQSFIKLADGTDKVALKSDVSGTA